MISYIIISILMVACVALTVQAVKIKPIRAELRKASTDLQRELDAELRREAAMEFKPRRPSRTKYRARRKTGRCRARGRK